MIDLSDVRKVDPNARAVDLKEGLVPIPAAHLPGGGKGRRSHPQGASTAPGVASVSALRARVPRRLPADYQRITTLAVHRVRELDVSDEEFPVPRVDVDGHVSKAFGIFVSDQEEVEIVFDAEIAWKLEERTYHPSERKERRADGALYRLQSSAQWEIIPWVQSFGALAELVAPASWRDALRANVEVMMGRYGGATPVRSSSP